MAKLFANSGDPDQMPYSAASDLGLHCLPINLLRVFWLQWVKSMLSEISAKDIPNQFPYFFKKIGFDLSCKLSPLDKRCYSHNIFLIFPQKHML